MNLPRRYSYNMRWRLVIGGGAFFFACAVVFIYQLKSGEQLDFHGFRFSPVESKIVLTILLGFSIAAVIVCVLGAIRRLTNPQILELTEDAITLPEGFIKSKTSRIAYTDILRWVECRVSGQTSLYFYTAGRSYAILAHLLPNKSSYEE